VPSNSDFSFYTLGEHIQSIWPGDRLESLKTDESFVRCKTREKLGESGGTHQCSKTCSTVAVRSGTSFATPIAAAMTVILFQFYNRYKGEIKGRIRLESEKFKSIKSVRWILTRMGTQRAGLGTVPGIRYLQPPTHDRTGSDFHFELDERYSPRSDRAKPTDASLARKKVRPFTPYKEARDEWGHTYEEFFWRRLVNAINDGRKCRY